MMQLKMPLFATLISYISYTPAPRFVKEFLREYGSFVLQNDGVCGHARPYKIAKTVPQNSPLSPCA
jgi:hypothetical protein